MVNEALLTAMVDIVGGLKDVEFNKNINKKHSKIDLEAGKEHDEFYGVVSIYANNLYKDSVFDIVNNKERINKKFQDGKTLAAFDVFYDLGLYKVIPNNTVDEYKDLNIDKETKFILKELAKSSLIHSQINDEKNKTPFIISLDNIVSDIVKEPFAFNKNVDNYTNSQDVEVYSVILKNLNEIEKNYVSEVKVFKNLYFAEIDIDDSKSKNALKNTNINSNASDTSTLYCHSNCHKNCYRNCHGSRGWR